MYFLIRLFNAMCVCLLCVLMPNVESEKLLLNSTEQLSQINFNSIPEVNCGETQKMADMCFKNLPPHLMEFLTTTKTVMNKADIASKCTVFKLGMQCFDRYVERCLSKEKIIHLKNNVAGATKFLSKFCNDRFYQAEYMRHKECFSHIQDDWKRCTTDFQNILTDEFNGYTNSKTITNKYMQFCCARHAYQICVYNSARFKCYKNSAEFAKNTVRMLSEEKLFNSCKNYEKLLCAAPETQAKNLLIFSMIAVVWRSVLKI